MAARKSQIKAKAITLRKRGLSYNEICEKLNIAKSTCSVWLRGIRLDPIAVNRLSNRKDKGRQKANLTLRQYREERDRYIRESVLKICEEVQYTAQIEKILCAILYWAEGGKRESRLSFTNSDPVMIQVFLNLLRKSFNIHEEKLSATLHLHGYHDVRKQLRFWSKTTRIPRSKISIYRKPESGKNIRINYPGCIAVRYNDVRLAKEVEFLYKCFAAKYMGV